jgi:hypothetical protein
MSNVSLVKTLRAEIKESSDLRAALADARETFEAKKDKEWAKIRDRVKQDFNHDERRFRIRHAMLELHEVDKMNITQLGAIYGTKDRRTVMNLLDMAREERAQGIMIGRPEHLEITALEDGTYLVEVENYSQWETSEQIPYTGKMVAVDQNGLPFINDSDVPVHMLYSPLHKELASASKDAPLMQKWAECVK